VDGASVRRLNIPRADNADTDDADTDDAATDNADNSHTHINETVIWVCFRVVGTYSFFIFYCCLR